MTEKLIRRRSRTKNKQVSVTGLPARVDSVEETLIRSDLAAFRPGDIVRVGVRIDEGDKKRIQAFEGVVIKRSGRGASRSFVVRKISHGVGVERIFMECSPRVAEVKVVQHGKVRRAKLYYLRQLEGKKARIERDLDAGSSSSDGASSSGGAGKQPASAS